MLKQASQEFRIFFLLEFTKELINQYGGGDVFALESVIKQEDKIEKIQRKEIVHSILQPKPAPRIIQKMPSKILRIPEPKLPLRLQYLRPIPTRTEIDLGRLNALVSDPLVRSIECNGDDTNIVVNGTMGTKKTSIILSKEEINEIIIKFSQTAKIPTQEGIFKVAVGKLIFSAIVSDIISSKFIIRKMIGMRR